MLLDCGHGGHGVNPIAHFDIVHRQPGLIFTSRGGSGAAYALSPGSQVAVGGVLPDYVPEWRPPPPRVVIDLPPDEGSTVVAHDWGHLGRQIIGGWMRPDPSEGYDYGGQVGGGAGDPTGSATGMATEAPGGAVAGGLGPQSCEGMVWTGGVPPKGFKVVNFCGMGVLRKVRRRRRRRILTASDKADISYIISTAGKGQLAASLIHKSTH